MHEFPPPPGHGSQSEDGDLLHKVIEPATGRDGLAFNRGSHRQGSDAAPGRIQDRPPARQPSGDGGGGMIEDIHGDRIMNALAHDGQIFRYFRLVAVELANDPGRPAR